MDKAEPHRAQENSRQGANQNLAPVMVKKINPGKGKGYQKNYSKLFFKSEAYLTSWKRIR